MRTYVFKIVLEQDEDFDGNPHGWHVYCPTLVKQGGSTWGGTKEEAVANIREVLEMTVESMLEHGESDWRQQLFFRRHRYIWCKSSPSIERSFPQVACTQCFAQEPLAESGVTYAEAFSVVERKSNCRSSGRPENSIRAHLDTMFKKKGWPWPTHPIDWKRYFMEYHMELLFGNGPRNAPEAPEED